MPTASDGKKFPYTKEGMSAYKKYQAGLDKNKRTMAKPKPKPLRGDMNEANMPSTSGGGYN